MPKNEELFRLEIELIMKEEISRGDQGRVHRSPSLDELESRREMYAPRVAVPHEASFGKWKKPDE